MNSIFLILSSIFGGLAIFLFSYVFFDLLHEKFALMRARYEADYRSRFERLYMDVDIRRFAKIHMLAVILIPVAIYLMIGKVLVALAIGVAAFYIPRIKLARTEKQRLNRLNLQIMDALGLIGNALKAGLTLPQSFHSVIQQMPTPISEEFNLVMREYGMGISFDEALTNMARRVPSTNIDNFVSSILIARRTGGDIAEVLEKMGESMKEIFRLEGKVDALTSQGKAQGLILGSLPFALGVALYSLDKTMIIPLLTTPHGYAICMMICIFWGIGAFFIWKIVNVEV